MSKQKKLLSLVVILALSLVAVFLGVRTLSNTEELPTESTVLIIDQAGETVIGEQYEKIVVQVGDVVLSNGSAQEIIVEKSVGDGEVTLKDVDTSLLNLNGGGENSIYITGGSNIASVKILRVDGKIHVAVEDTSSVISTTIYDGSQDVVLEGQVGNVSIEASGINVELVGTNLGSVSVSGQETTVYIDEASAIETASLLESADKSKFIFKGSVTNVQVDNNNATIEIIGQVENLMVNDLAENTTIIVSADASVKKLITNASVSSEGEGVIDEMTTDAKANISGSVEVTLFNLPVNPATPSKPIVNTPTKPVSTESTGSTSTSSTSSSTSTTPTVTNYTLTFNANGGTSVLSVTQASGSKLASFPTSTKDGYSLVSWYKDSEFKTVWSLVNDSFSSNQTLYAKWTAKSYKISFVENGGSAVTDIEEAFGSSISAPTAPTKTGYTFAGWYSNEGLTTSYTFSTMPSSNLTLYAKWTAKNYKISFDENDGSAVTDIEEAFGSSISAPTAPTKTGYTFAGWYSNEGLTTSYTFSTMPSSNLTLYAKWTAKNYKISFDENDGSAVTDIEEAFGSSISAPTAPTKTGYDFAGWYSDEGLTSAYTFSTMPSSNLTLYAKWNEITHSLQIFGKSTLGLPTLEVSIKLDNSSVSNFELLFDGSSVSSTTNGTITVPSTLLEDLSRISIKINNSTYKDSDNTLSIIQ